MNQASFALINLEGRRDRVIYFVGLPIIAWSILTVRVMIKDSRSYIREHVIFLLELNFKHRKNVCTLLTRKGWVRFSIGV